LIALKYNEEIDLVEVKKCIILLLAIGYWLLAIGYWLLAIG